MPQWTPKHTSFMDPDMLRLFERMNPSDLNNYRMFGGTALALYINHRHSVDFDFFSVVLRNALQSFDSTNNLFSVRFKLRCQIE